MTPAQYLENIARRMGLADTSKVDMTTEVPTSDGRTKSGYKVYEVKAHRVQLLDPATTRAVNLLIL